ncbi:response regulator [Bdellovibrionota bacterium FG-1]
MTKATEHRKSVLIVEDNPHIGDATLQFLTIEGFTAVLVANGQEALEAIPNLNDLGLILLDLMMPVLSGREFLQERMKSSAMMAIPVYIVSTMAQESDLTTLNATGVLPKPTDLMDLLATVRRYCEG